MTEAAFYADLEHCGEWPLDTIRAVVIQSRETIWRMIDSADEKARARSFVPESVGCFTEVLKRGH